MPTPGSLFGLEQDEEGERRVGFNLCGVIERPVRVWLERLRGLRKMSRLLEPLSQLRAPVGKVLDHGEALALQVAAEAGDREHPCVAGAKQLSVHQATLS